MSKAQGGAIAVVLTDSLAQQPATKPVAKPGMSQTDYDNELSQALPKIQAARALKAVTSKAEPALTAMEDAFDAAAKADAKKDFPGASTALKTALKQAEAAADGAREDFQGRQSRAVAKLGTRPERINKLAAAPAPVTQALKKATDAQAAAKRASEAAQPDWAKAFGAVGDFNKAIDELDPVCLVEAGKTAAGFDQRYKDVDEEKPASNGIVKKYADYTAARKPLDERIKASDGLGALEASAATEAALAALETAAAPSDADKQRKVQAAYDTLTNLKDRDLEKKSTQEKAELALDLCAKGIYDENGDLRVDEARQLVRLYNKSPPDKLFLKKREQQRAAIVEKVSKMPEIANLFDKKGNFDKAAWANFAQDPDNAKALLKKICDVQTAALGMPAIEVNKEPDPPEGKQPGQGLTYGGYNPETNQVDLNLHADCLIPIEEALTTILHETFHAHQDVIVKKLKAGEIKPGDPDYPTALMYLVNDIGVGYVQSADVGHKNYASQPTEIDAEFQGGQAAKAVLKQIKKAAKARK